MLTVSCSLFATSAQQVAVIKIAQVKVISGPCSRENGLNEWNEFSLHAVTHNKSTLGSSMDLSPESPHLPIVTCMYVNNIS